MQRWMIFVRYRRCMNVHLGGQSDRAVLQSSVTFIWLDYLPPPPEQDPGLIAMDDNMIRRVKESVAKTTRLAENSRSLVVHSRLLLSRIYQRLLQEEYNKAQRLRDEIDCARRQDTRAIQLHLGREDLQYRVR